MVDQSSIIQSAISLYQKKGLSFTMDDIAKDLHIAKKTIYRFFPSKEDLLQGIVEYGFHNIQENKKRILKEEIPYIEKLKKLLIAMPTDIESIDFKQLEPLSIQYPSVSKSISKHLQSNWEPVFDFIQEGIQKKIIREVPLSMIEVIVTSSMNALLTSSIDEHTYQQSLQDLVDILLKGILYEKNQ